MVFQPFIARGKGDDIRLLPLRRFGHSKNSITACIRVRPQRQRKEGAPRQAGPHRIDRRYWIRVWNILDRPKYGFDLTLVNPAVVHAQGRKTDRIDARRIAELTRTGAHLQQDRNRVINRIGRSARDGEYQAWVGGVQHRGQEQALGRLRDKLPELISAMEGSSDEYFRWMLTQLLHPLESRS